ncbi:hypothetical protein ACFCV9_04995 [Streptomyces sp. NPDC056367]|uniref:hypothetical protein n=1 Tax=Streptomyces sp. NPDC056367 TaxID=3345797 RepID=UPI0035E1B840
MSRLHPNRVRPALLEWSNRHDHLRAVTGDDVLTYITLLYGHQRHDPFVALRSLSAWAKRNGPIFRNPTRRIKVGPYEYAVPKPLHPEAPDGPAGPPAPPLAEPSTANLHLL